MGVVFARGKRTPAVSERLGSGDWSCDEWIAAASHSVSVYVADEAWHCCLESDVAPRVEADAITVAPDLQARVDVDFAAAGEDHPALDVDHREAEQAGHDRAA